MMMTTNISQTRRFNKNQNLYTLFQLVLLFSITTLLCLNTGAANAKTTRFFFEKSQLNKNWYFIDKFCFDDQGVKRMGYVNWNLSGVNPVLLTNLSVALYMDDDWDRLQRDLVKSNYRLPCESVVSSNYSRRIVSLEKFPTRSISINEHKRPHYWFMVLGACDRDASQLKGGKKQIVELDFSWLNPGSVFKRQFSKDRYGIFAVLIAFTPLFTLMTVAYTVSVAMLIRAKCFHWIIRMFYSSLLLYTLSIWMALFHNIKYSRDGLGIPFFDGLSTSIRLMAEMTFMILLYLIASGWTITQPYLRHMKYLAGIAVGLLFLYASMFAWSQITLATQITTSDYVYDTTPGVLLSILRIPALGFFAYALNTTYKKEVSINKIRFYRVFSAFSIWFLILPTLVFTALCIPVQHRAKWIEGLSRCVEFISYLSMFILLWYSRARKYFALSDDESKQGMYEDL